MGYIIIIPLNCIIFWALFKIEKIPKIAILITTSIIFGLSLGGIIYSLIFIGFIQYKIVGIVIIYFIFNIGFIGGFIGVYTWLFKSIIKELKKAKHEWNKNSF